MHAELAEIWRDIDADPDVNVAILTGAGRVFSAGGDFALVEGIADDFETRARVWKEARDIVYNIINCCKPVVSAMRGVAVGAGLVCGLLADVSIATQRLPHHRRPHAPRRRRRRPRGDRLAAALRHGEGEILPAHLRHAAGEEAERIGLISLVVDDAELDAQAVAVATRLAEGAQSAIRWTKYALNNWLRRWARPSTPRWRWNSSASPARRCAKGSRRTARSARRRSRPARRSEGHAASRAFTMRNGL